jgi:hypothetical protein
VEKYLRRLRGALRSAPISERREILDNVTAHIDAALTSTACSDADISRVLDSLGSAEVIAAEASRGWSPSGRRADGLALVLLELGGFVVPVVGWVIGVVLVWSSRTWTTAEKWMATLIVPGGLSASVLAWMFLPGGQRICIGGISGTISLPLGAGCVVHGVVTPMWLRAVVAVTLAVASLVTALCLWGISRSRRLRYELDSVS